ncbi:hypothetical protein IAT40_002730 [Kwoniella sp. CBS 6097]
MSSTTTTAEARKRPRQSSLDSSNTRDPKRRKDGSSKKAAAGEVGKGKSVAGNGIADGSKKEKEGQKDEGKSWITNQIDSMEKLYKEVLIQAAMIFQHQAFSKRLGLQERIPLHMMHRLEITWRTYEALRKQTEQCMAQSGQNVDSTTPSTAQHARFVPSLHTKPTSTSTLSALSSLATSSTPPKTIDLPIPSHLAINLDNLRSASPVPVPVVVGANGIAALEQATSSAPPSIPEAGSVPNPGSNNAAQSQQSEQVQNQQAAGSAIAAQDQEGQVQENVINIANSNSAPNEGAPQGMVQNGTTSTVPLPHSHPLSTDSAVQIPPVQPTVQPQLGSQIPLSATQPLPQAQLQQQQLLQPATTQLQQQQNQIPFQPQLQMQPQPLAPAQAPAQAQTQLGTQGQQGDVDYSALGLAELTALINGDSFDPMSMGLPMPDNNQQSQQAQQLQQLQQPQMQPQVQLIDSSATVGALQQQQANIGHGQQQQPNMSTAANTTTTQAQPPAEQQQQRPDATNQVADFDFAQAFGAASAGTEGDFSALAGLFPSSIPDFESSATATSGGDTVQKQNDSNQNHSQSQNQNQNNSQSQTQPPLQVENQNQDQNQSQESKGGDINLSDMFGGNANSGSNANDLGTSGNGNGNGNGNAVYNMTATGDAQQQQQSTQPPQQQQQQQQVGLENNVQGQDPDLSAFFSLDSAPSSQTQTQAPPQSEQQQQQQQQVDQQIQQQQAQPQPQPATQPQDQQPIVQNSVQSQQPQSLPPTTSSVPDFSQSQIPAIQSQNQNLVDTQSVTANVNEQFGELGGIDMSDFDFTDAGMGMDLGGDEFERLMAEFQ